MAAFRRAGGYDESFTHNEDAELDCRQRALGGRVYLNADIRIGYRPRQRSPRSRVSTIATGPAAPGRSRRHPGSLRLRQLAVPVHVLGALLALAVSPWWALGLVWPALYVLALLATSVWMGARHRSACGLWAGPAAGVMHTAWGVGSSSVVGRHAPAALAARDGGCS